MQVVNQSLAEVKDLFRKVVGQPAPEIDPRAYTAFPPGVDPVDYAVQEVEHLKRLSEQLSLSPTAVGWIPPSDSFVTDDAFVILVELPGVARDDLKVVATGGECIVRGERMQTDSTADAKPVTLERPWGRFERRFVLPAGSDPDRVTARYRDGILELRIAIDRGALPKQTKIDVAWARED